MIISPKVGHFIKGKSDARDPHIRNRSGHIIEVQRRYHFDFLAKFENFGEWWCSANDFNSELLTPEEQEQQNRLEHAMKYF